MTIRVGQDRLQRVYARRNSCVCRRALPSSNRQERLPVQSPAREFSVYRSLLPRTELDLGADIRPELSGGVSSWGTNGRIATHRCTLNVLDRWCDKVAHLLIHETVLRLSLDDVFTWCTRPESTRKLGLTSACKAVRTRVFTTRRGQETDPCKSPCFPAWGSRVPVRPWRGEPASGTWCRERKDRRELEAPASLTATFTLSALYHPFTI